MADTWQRALVTGASSGIGRALCEQLAAAGTDLVLVARSTETLTELGEQLGARHGVEAEVLPADLTDPDECGEVEARLAAADAPVDLLVNNAGFGTVGRFADQDRDREEAQVRLNVIALMRLAHVAAGRMRDAGHGGILNVSSLGGLQPVPFSATYAGTKAFVTSLSEALHEELRGTGVHVTCLCPGFTRTDFQDTAGMEQSAIPDIAWMGTGPVAAAGLAGVRDNRAVVIPGVGNRVAALISHVTPTAVTRKAIAATARRRL